MDSLTIIFVAMAAIFFGYGGYVLGNFYPLIKRNKKDRNTVLIEHKIDSDEDIKNSGEISAEIETDIDSTSAQEEKKKKRLPQMMDPEETIQIWYDLKSRRIVPEIKGDLLDINKITDEEQQKLTWLLLDLQEQVGLIGNLKKKIEDAENFDEKDGGATEIGLNPIKSFVKYLKSDVPIIEEKKDSIPEQINEILQDQIVGTPLESSGITVIEWPDKGVVFMVGIEQYEDIENIPDENIQAAIKKAVKTWEDLAGE